MGTKPTVMKVGTVVNLTQGGALMTITVIDGDLITAMWTDDGRKPHEIEVHRDALEISDLEEYTN